MAVFRYAYKKAAPTSEHEVVDAMIIPHEVDLIRHHNVLDSKIDDPHFGVRSAWLNLDPPACSWVFALFKGDFKKYYALKRRCRNYPQTTFCLDPMTHLACEFIDRLKQVAAANGYPIEFMGVFEQDHES
jgi:hypothetical protein